MAREYRHRWGLSSVIVTIALAVACSSQVEVPETQKTDADASDSIPDWSLVEAAFDDWEPAAKGGGVSFLRRLDGESILLATGTDPSTGQALEVGARVRVGSISKTVVAAMVMQMVDEGSVDLDKPAGSYVEGLRVGDDVTVRQLLGHRSGIANYTESRGFFEVVLASPDRAPTPTDLLDFVAGNEDFEPGERFAYSNSNYIVAGILIEAIDERSLAESLETRIAEPLGLSQTAFDDGTFTDVAAGYSATFPGGDSASQSYRSVAHGSWAAGGLVTTVEELATFFDALFFGTLVSEDARLEMLADLDDGQEYGLGLHPGPDFGVGHGGAIIGFNSIAEVNLDTREMLIVVINNDLRAPEVASGMLWAAAEEE